jgi:hypothetical protein
LLAFRAGSAAAGRTRNAIYDSIDPHFTTRRQAIWGDYHLKRQNLPIWSVATITALTDFDTIRPSVTGADLISLKSSWSIGAS